MVTVSLSIWTHSYTASDCGPFTYKLTTPRTALSLSLTPKFELSLYTTDHSQNMVAFSSEQAALNTYLEGILYKTVPSDPYKSDSIPFDFRIISLQNTHI